jgi:hypothetical protein
MGVMILVQPELDILFKMKSDTSFRIVQMDTQKLWYVVKFIND